MYKAIFCFLLICLQPFAYGTNHLPLSDTDGGSNSLVFNAVSVISGDYVESANDLTLLGPEPFHFQRFYSSADTDNHILYGNLHGHLYDGWNLNQKSTIQVNEAKDGVPAEYTEKTGRTIPFKNHNKKKGVQFLTFSERDAKGYTNTGSGFVGGCTHAKNIKLELTKKNKTRTILMKDGLGEEKFFKAENGLHNLRVMYERKPTGNSFHYIYNKDRDLEQIQGMNKAGKIFSWIRFLRPTKDEFKKNPCFEIHSSDGRKLVYKLKTYLENPGKLSNKKYRVSHVIGDHLPKVSYKYSFLDREDSEESAHISKKCMPGSRYLMIDYYKHGSGVKTTDFRIDRVKCLKAPAGSDLKPVKIYRFDYIAKKIKDDMPLDGYTSVLDGNRHLMHYGYTKEHRLDYVKRFRGNHPSNYTPYSTEKYTWNHEGSLISRSIQDENGHHLVTRTFEYDARGNIIKDLFFGNLKGVTGVDTWAIRYRYSEDGCNLLLEENEPNGKSTHYAYDDATKVLKSKYVLENGIIRIREFYDHDENALVICHTTDDGMSKVKDDLTGATTRFITRFYNSEVIPIGLPIRVDECYYDFTLGQESLLKRKFNHYDIQGRLLASYIYDSHGRYIYSNSFKHDAHGNVIQETNGAGDTIERKFNKNNNLVFERGFLKDSYKNFHYDFMGRLVQIQECHDDGTILNISNSYDRMGNLKAVVDPFGNRTIYLYDEFNRQIQTNYPGFYDENGSLVSTFESNEYDIFGNVTKATDKLGSTVKKEYNARRMPVRIDYEDGMSESFIYNDDGTIKRSISKNGSFIDYTHDCFHRLLKKEHFSKEGTFLFKTSSTYNSFNKLTETDPQGIVTNYQYDARGFLISTSKGSSLKEFEYDARLLLEKVKEWVSETEYHTTIYTYDILDQVIEERIENSKSGLLRVTQYAYDKKGNKVQTIVCSENDFLVTKNVFDSHNKPVLSVDPSGNETHYSYNYQAFNEQGQCILEKRETSPLGVSVITQFSVFDKPECIITKNKMGEIIAEKRLFYDAFGNIVLSSEKAISEGLVLRDVKTKWEYNKKGLLTYLFEAYGDTDQKTTEFKYNAFDEKETVIKPDGTKIYHSYDILGRLTTFSSSDHSFSYTYEYDDNDNLIKSYDGLNNQWTLRDYDSCGNLNCETLGSGLKVAYLYDRTKRPTSVTLPDSSSISYTYEGLNLKKVDRLSKDQKLLYTHDYLTHDCQGHVTKEKQILAGDFVNYLYDPNGRLIEIHSDTFSENASYDQAGNLTLIKRKEALNEFENAFTYDDLNQLSSEKGIVSHQYSHDSLNNCVAKDSKQQQVNALNQLLKTLDATFSYDKSGNRIEEELNGVKTTYEYDALDRLVKVIFPHAHYFYTYDALNRRLSKIKKDSFGKILSQIDYLHVGQNEIGAVEKGQIKELRVLGTGKGAEIGASIAFEIEDKTYIPVHDQNGNIVQIKDACSGRVVETYRYLAFGEREIFDSFQNKLNSSAIYNPWGYASKRFDEETGFIHFGRRYYDAKTAKWTSPDPLGFDGGSNLYSYVFNSPVSHFDLYGLKIGNFDKFSMNFSSDLGSSYHVNFGFGIMGSLIGYTIQSIANHAIPVPVVREVAMATGGFIAGDGFHLDSKSWKVRQSQGLAPFGSCDLGNHENITINGILNNQNNGEEMGQQMSNALGGQFVYHIYNASRGLMTDLSECVLLIAGYETESVKIALENIEARLKSVGPGGTIDLYAHSMGGLITARAIEHLKPGQLRQISIYTFGSAKMIHNIHLSSCINYVSPFDPVPFIADPIGCLKGIFCKSSNVEFPYPRGYPLMDHCFQGGTYQHKCIEITQESRRKHGTV